MKSWLLAGFLAAAEVVSAFQGFPRCTAVEPDEAKSGDTISAKCENVDKGNAANFYLTDGKKDTKVAITEQSAAEIKFKVPQMKAGRYHLAFLTSNGSSMVEEPVVLTVQ